MRERSAPITPILPPSEKDLAKHDERVSRRLHDTQSELTQIRGSLRWLVFAFTVTALATFGLVALLLRG